ncbi:hypothetical protein [Streptomyces sp. URMC 129]|uniref:hypothetical protein n=1 Tax=Streptomyces sp. URMC 129 TaxID=3423407 RepID=UPI003F1A0542
MLPGWDHDDVGIAHEFLSRVAAFRGIYLVATYVEPTGSQFHAWQDMIAEARAERVPRVMVLSSRHLHPEPAFHLPMRAMLEDAGGRLWVVPCIPRSRDYGGMLSNA